MRRENGKGLRRGAMPDRGGAKPAGQTPARLLQLYKIMLRNCASSFKKNIVYVCIIF